MPVWDLAFHTKCTIHIPAKLRGEILLVNLKIQTRCGKPVQHNEAKKKKKQNRCAKKSVFHSKVMPEHRYGSRSWKMYFS